MIFTITIPEIEASEVIELMTIVDDFSDLYIVPLSYHADYTNHDTDFELDFSIDNSVQPPPESKEPKNNVLQPAGDSLLHVY